MKRVLSFGLLVLVATIVTGGMSGSAAAQDDPEILFRIAKNAQDQIKNNISNETSDEIKKLFEEGSNHVDNLSQALSENNVESAREYFLSAMKAFKEISQMLTYNEALSAETANRDDPTSTLQKLYKYTLSLKKISEKYQIPIDFAILEGLFETAKEQIRSEQLTDAQETIGKISKIVRDIEKQLREQALLREPERAHQYAQKYLEQLDRLIDHAKSQQISDDIVQKLEDAREGLLSASSPEEIVKEIRKIIYLKDQFELTANDSVELQILKAERTIYRLDQMGADSAILDDLQERLKAIKQSLSKGSTDQAEALLADMKSQLQKIVESLS